MGLKVLHNGYMVDSDLLLLDQQAREGDAVSGWRGDDSMSVAVTIPDPVTNKRTIQVRAVDANGVEYVAASVPEDTPGWRQLLLSKLVAGDWQHRAGDPIRRVIDAQMKRQKDMDTRFREFVTEEFAPKLHHALVKDGAAQRQDFYMTPRKGDRP